MRLAIIGCGAVVELGHLPALRETGCFEVVALVDRDEARAQRLARQLGGCNVFTKFSDAIPRVDAAIIALPHSFHAPVSCAMLEAGKHVLVEKPMALNAAECGQMLTAARSTGARLAIGHMRRYFPGLEIAKRLLDGGIVGAVRRFDFRDGYTYCWPVASDFFFRKETAGGGVLLDTGAHTLDTLLWLLGDVAEFRYSDDAHGGVEADCLIDLTLVSGARGVVELSRTRILRNSAVIEGDAGSLEVFFHQQKAILRRPSRHAVSIDLGHERGAVALPDLVQMLRDQLLDWHDAITNRREPSVSGEDGAKVVALMENMYRRRMPLIFPWDAGSPDRVCERR